MAVPFPAEKLFEVEAPPAHPLSGSFRRNMALPVHRWFRYSAGFSAAWVEHEIQQRMRNGPVRVCDPFAGSGTTLIAAQRVGAESAGVDSHPFVSRVAQAKLCWDVDIGIFEKSAKDVLRRTQPRPLPDPLPDLLEKIFEPEALGWLYGIKASIEEAQYGDDVERLLWLALVAILRACSPVGTAQWQYVLPNRSKARVADPIEAFRIQAELMAQDMRGMQALTAPGEATFTVADGRETAGAEDGWANLVVTSPPYANNYDYADATRIEMTFLQEITSWGDLQEKVRTHLVRSCSQHMRGFDGAATLSDPLLEPIADELSIAYGELEEARKTKSGKKAYHAMAVAYFLDMASSWKALRRAVGDGGEVLFVIGDSAPYGVHLPADRWLGALALAAGFETYEFSKLRDRNTSSLWKSRKHDVRLHEGILRVTG